MAKVSVLMPAYNVEKYIRESIESVISQTLKDIEIICIDDGSTDDTGKILDEYAQKDSRVRVIHKSNSGYGHSMNVALSKATGEYIGIVETDDFAAADMFESLYAHAKKHDADLVKSNFYRYRSGNREFYEVLGPYDSYGKVFRPLDSQHKSILKIAASIWSGIYRRKMLLDNGIVFTETPGASYQDTSFALKTWTCAERAYLVKEAYLHYRVDNASSSVKSGAKVFCICDEFREIEAFAKEHDHFDVEALEMLQAVKLNKYLWNLNRVEYGFKYAFLLQMNKEFKGAEEQGLLSRELFSDREWEILNTIISEPNKYYEEIKSRLLGKYSDVREIKADLKAAREKNIYFKKEIERIKQSKTFKIGKMFTRFPGMFRKR